MFLAHLLALALPFAAERQSVEDLRRLTTPPVVHNATTATTAATPQNPRPIYFDSIPHKGQPTRIYSWLGLPEKRNGKVPGIVLVHGGGGTAYREWVKKWNDHGFAAISIAVEGQTDERVANPPNTWQRNPNGGPARDGIYSDSKLPLAEQWMYHALAATVLANSLLRSLPEVDPNNVGIMGISWGGVITSTIIGIDTRFAFAIPTYGCGALSDIENHWGKALHDNELFKNVWEPLLWLPRARMPILWLTWLYDPHFPLTAQSRSYNAAPGPNMVAVLPDMKHSHLAGWNPPDSYAFAEQIVRARKPWLAQRKATNINNRITVHFDAQRPIDAAQLYTTSGTGYAGTRQWEALPATIKTRGRRVTVSAQLPAGATAWFVNVRSGPLTASSRFYETTATRASRVR